MRVTSGFFVSALLKRLNSASCFAALRRRGAEEAGAIFICVDMLEGQCRLYGPAPPDFDSPDDGGRRFTEIQPGKQLTPLDASERLAKEISFDSDIWIVDIEDRSGARHRDFF